LYVAPSGADEPAGLKQNQQTQQQQREHLQQQRQQPSGIIRGPAGQQGQGQVVYQSNGQPAEWGYAITVEGRRTLPRCCRPSVGRVMRDVMRGE
jgi:hypothetical protein